MRIAIAILMIAASIAIARAIPPSQQIIMFGNGSSASGGSCNMNGIFDLTNTCNDIYYAGRLI